MKSKHQKAVKTLIDTLEAMLNAMEKHKFDTDKLASQPEFKILVHLIKTIIDKELNIPNDLVEKIEGLKEDLDLDKGFQKTLH